jgi:DNA polymerase-3 subunit epsilon
MPILAGATLLVMDTETMGFDVATGNRLVEVAWIRIEDGRIVDDWTTLVNPGKPIPPDATKIHRITDAMVAAAPRPSDIAVTVRATCADVPLVFHNAPFDLPFMRMFFEEGGAAPLTNPIVDTLGIARELHGGSGNRLGELAQKYGLSGPAQPAAAGADPERMLHSARWDAHLTAQLLLALAPKWEAKHPGATLAELAAASMDKMRLTARR